MLQAKAVGITHVADIACGYSEQWMWVLHTVQADAKGDTCVASMGCVCHTHCRLGLRVSHMRQT